MDLIRKGALIGITVALPISFLISWAASSYFHHWIWALLTGVIAFLAAFMIAVWQIYRKILIHSLFLAKQVPVRKS